MEEEKKTKRKRTKKNRRRSSAFTKAKKKQRKVVVLGSIKCGKTAFIKRFVENTFSDEYKPTVEDLFIRNFKHQGRHYTLQITDMASPFQFPTMRDLHIRAAELILLLYEIDKEASFAEARQVFEIVRTLRADVPVILIGTKQDVIPLKRQNSEEYMESFYSNDIPSNGHILTSAKNDIGVQEAFAMGLDEFQARKQQNTETEEGGDGQSDTSSIGSNENCIIL